MRNQVPNSQTMKISAVRSELNALVNRVYRHETRVVVEKSGIPVAAIISTDDLERLNALDDEDRKAWAVLQSMREPFQGVSSEEIEHEADKAAAEVRTDPRT